MGQWAPGDLRILSKEAFKMMAKMMNVIERGRPWPEQLQKARAAFLAQDMEDMLNPLAYWALLMLPSTYRMWPKTRLRRLQPWVDSWKMDEMYAGVDSRGADDAAYSTAVLLEWCRVHKMEYIGGAADIYKCFDQVMRPPVYRLLEEPGMPERVLDAYRRYLDGLQVHNTVAGGIGEAYGRPTSIPQGGGLCP